MHRRPSAAARGGERRGGAAQRLLARRVRRRKTESTRSNPLTTHRLTEWHGRSLGPFLSSRARNYAHLAPLLTRPFRRARQNPFGAQSGDACDPAARLPARPARGVVGARHGPPPLRQGLGERGAGPLAARRRGAGASAPPRPFRCFCPLPLGAHTPLPSPRAARPLARQAASWLPPVPEYDLPLWNQRSRGKLRGQIRHHELFARCDAKISSPRTRLATRRAADPTAALAARSAAHALRARRCPIWTDDAGR